MQDSEKISVIKSWLGTGSINIFGLPFAGKDTHGTILAKQLGASLIGGGDILRNGSEFSEEAKEIIKTGKLAPTDEYVRVMVGYLARSEFSSVPLVLSSVGRWEGEEHAVIEGAMKSNHPIKAVLYLQVDPLDAYERWQISQEKQDRADRYDDMEHILQIRFEEFMSKTLPVIQTYDEKGLLIEIDGKPPVDVVTSKIIDELYSRATI